MRAALKDTSSRGNDHSGSMRESLGTSNSSSASSGRTESLALQWALQQRGVSDVVVGLTQPRHVEAALRVTISSSSSEFP